MPSLTKEDLRNELEQFAALTIQKQLSELSQTLQESMRHDMQRIFASSLQAYHVEPAVSTAAEPFTLPGQVLTSLPVASRTATSRGSPGCATSRMLFEPTSSSAFGDESVSSSPLTCSYALAKDRVAAFRSAVGGEPYMADELRSMGYFHRCKGMSKVDVEEETDAVSPSTAVNAKELMLRTDANPDVLIAQNPSVANMLGYRSQLNLGCIDRMVCSHKFEYCMSLIICVNAIYIGIETEVTSADVSMMTSLWVRVIGIAFFLIFAVELGLRIYVFRCWFFSWLTPCGTRNQHLSWNLFDTFIVFFQALEIILREVFALEGFVFGNVIVLRMLRIVRLARLFRMAKHLRWFRTLRIIVSCIFYSIESFFWAIASLQAITYIFAVYLTEIAMTHIQNYDDCPTVKANFGKLSDTWESLLKAISGGIDWGDLIPSLTMIGFFSAYLPFLVYLLFTLIVLMNVFTGIFLDNASEKTKQETEVQLLRHAYAIFRASDQSKNNMIAKEDFKTSLEHPDVHNFFSAINLDIQQAEVLFELLDTSSDGLISCDEFLRGCLRLHGTAKALDLLILSREVTQLLDGIAEITKLNTAASSVNRQMISMHSRTSKDNQRLLQEIARTLSGRESYPVSSKPTSDCDKPIDVEVTYVV